MSYIREASLMSGNAILWLISILLAAIGVQGHLKLIAAGEANKKPLREMLFNILVYTGLLLNLKLVLNASNVIHIIFD